LSQDVDLNGDVDVDSIVDLARRPSDEAHTILVEESRTEVSVEVNERVYVYVAVKLKVWVDVEVVVEVVDPTRRPGVLCSTPLQS
jgi:hypothetical protein